MALPRKNLSDHDTSSVSVYPWRSILGLILVWVATMYNLSWAWGVLFLFWVVPDLFSGVTYFMEPIYRVERPLLYWAIVISWLLMSIYMMASFFWPELMMS